MSLLKTPKVTDIRCKGNRQRPEDYVIVSYEGMENKTFTATTVVPREEAQDVGMAGNNLIYSVYGRMPNIKRLGDNFVEFILTI